MAMGIPSQLQLDNNASNFGNSVVITSTKLLEDF